MKREKDKMSERQAEMALALKDVTEDFKIQREENDRLKERISIYERQSLQQRQSQAPKLQMLKESTNTSNHKASAYNYTEKKKLKKLNDLVADYRKENERFVEKVSKLQQKLSTNSHHSSALTGIGVGNRNEMAMKERLESTTSYFSDEDEAVREFAYGKIKNDLEGFYDENEFNNMAHDTPARSIL